MASKGFPTSTYPLTKSVQGLQPSATLLINEQSNALIQEGKKVYRLGFGQSPFPIPSSIVKALQEHAHEKDYLPVKGLPQLRTAVSNFNKRKLGLDCTFEDVMIGPGSKELIFNLQMAFDGDLLLPSPSWVSYEPQANLNHKKVWWIPTSESNGWRLTPDALDEICSSVSNPNKLLILNYPNNPTGTSYSLSQLKPLADVCRKHNILVIADEIYGELHHKSPRISLSKFYPEGTIISEGLSKWCGAGGWRLGTFTFPKNYHWLQDAMATIASETYSAVSAPIQYAAVEAFNGNEEISDYLQHSQSILDAIGNFMYQKLSAINITMSAPKGGFYLFPNFEYYRLFLQKKGIQNSSQLCEILLKETGVALLPGVAFGRPSEELTARLSYVDFDGKKLLELIKNEKITMSDDFIEKNCPQIFEATLHIQSWLE